MGQRRAGFRARADAARRTISRRTSRARAKLQEALEKLAKRAPKDIRKKLRDAARRARIRRQADAADELLQLYAVTAKRGIDYRTARRINALRRRLGLPDDYLPDTLYLLQRSGGRITPDGKIIKGSYVIEPPGGTRAGRVANAAAAAITIAGMLAASMLIPGSGGAGIATTTTTAATEERKRTIQALRRARETLAEALPTADPTERRRITYAINQLDIALAELDRPQ